MNSQLELEKLYAKLGKAYYEGGFEEPLPELLPIFDQITRTKAWLKQMEQPRVCSRCGKTIEEGAVFCGNCGNRVG